MIYATSATASRHRADRPIDFRVGKCPEPTRDGVQVCIEVSAQNSQAVDSQKVWVFEQRPPMQIRVAKQSCCLDFANLAAMAVNIAGMIYDPVRPLMLKMRFAHKKHGVERLTLHGLVEEEQVAGLSRSDVARDAVGVVPQERGTIGKLHESALSKIVRLQGAGAAAE
jgi:hypothetical protein